MLISGTAYTQPVASSASVTGGCHWLVMSEPVQSTLRQVATNKSTGVTTPRQRVARGVPARSASEGLGSGAIGAVRREQFSELRSQPFQLAPHVRLDHAQLRLDPDVSAAQVRIVLDTDAVEQ